MSVRLGCSDGGCKYKRENRIVNDKVPDWWTSFNYCFVICFFTGLSHFPHLVWVYCKSNNFFPFVGRSCWYIDWIGRIIYQHQGSKINTRDKKTISGGISLYKLNLCSRSNFQSEGYHACHVARTVGSGGANQTLVRYSNTDCLAYGNYIISPSSAAMLYLLKRL